MLSNPAVDFYIVFFIGLSAYLLYGACQKMALSRFKRYMAIRQKADLVILKALEGTAQYDELKELCEQMEEIKFERC